MTITVTTTSSGPYTAVADTTFAVTFQSAGSDQVEVRLDGVVVDPGDYIFERDDDGTGEVVFLSAVTGEVMIYSEPTFQQTTEFQRFGSFFPDMVNRPLDKLATQLLWLKDRADALFSTVMRNSADRAGYYLAWDVDGAPVLSAGTGADAGLRTDLAAAGGPALINAKKAGTGAVTRPLDELLRDIPSPYDFDITEGNDSTTGFQQWLDDCKTERIAPYSSRHLIVPVSDTILMEPPTSGSPFIPNLDLSNITLLYAGTRDRPAFHIDGNSVGLVDRYPTLRLPRVIADGALQWPGTLQGDDCGILLEKVFRALIFCPYVEGFTKGFTLRNSSYNTVEMGHLQNNKYGDVLETKGAEVLFEYTNQNLIIGGRRGCSTDVALLGNAYGTAFAWDEVSSGRGHNSNTHLKPCYELGQPAGATYRVPLYMKGVGAFNVVQLARVEACKGPTAIYDGGGVNRAHSNMFDVDYNDNVPQTNMLLQVNDAAGNIYSERGSPIASHWRSGDLRHRLSSGGAAANSYISGEEIFAIDVAGSTPTRTLTTGSRFRTNAKCLHSAGAFVGTAIDTTKIKTFRVRTSAVPGHPGRISVHAFNASGTRLSGDATDATWGNEPYVKFAGTAGAASANYGNHYQASATDAAQETLFTVRDEVKKIYVGAVPGSFELGLQALEVTGHGTPEDAANANARTGLRVYADLDDNGSAKLATAKPDTAGVHGYYTKGQKIFNSAVAAAATDGWPVSTTGYLADAWTISTAYTVPGRVVTNDSGKMYELVTAGTSAGSGGPTGTGAAITDGTCVWNYVGVKAVFVTSAVTS